MSWPASFSKGREAKNRSRRVGDVTTGSPCRETSINIKDDVVRLRAAFDTVRALMQVPLKSEQGPCVFWVFENRLSFSLGSRPTFLEPRPYSRVLCDRVSVARDLLVRSWPLDGIPY
jgi:hypothetical protein